MEYMPSYSLHACVSASSIRVLFALGLLYSLQYKETLSDTSKWNSRESRTKFRVAYMPDDIK